MFEQVFDLYVCVLLEDDVVVMCMFNDVLKLVFEGQDVVIFNLGVLVKVLVEFWQIVLVSIGVKVDVVVIEVLYVKVLCDLKCCVIKSVIEDNEYVEDQKLVWIIYSCQLFDLGKVCLLFVVSLVDDVSLVLCKQFIDVYVQVLQSGVCMLVSGIFILYLVKDNGYWYSGNFDDLVGIVVGVLVLFEDWMQDVQVVNVLKVIGVFGCDLLLQQYCVCVVKIVLDQISGVDVMVEELKVKVKVKLVEDMMQECKVLCLIVEMMWIDECV